LRRCNRFRGFSANFARHGNLRGNYRILQGLNCKKLKSGSNSDGDGRYCSLNSRHSRAREVARSGANERERRGDSIPYLTYRGDASWRSNFAEEVATAGLFCSWLHFYPWRLPAGTTARTQAGQGRTVLHFLVVVCSTREGRRQVRAPGGGAQGDGRGTQGWAWRNAASWWRTRASRRGTAGGLGDGGGCAGTRGGKREVEKCETRVTRAGFIGTRRPEVWQAGGREGSRGGCVACRWAQGRGIRL
jgi:hypothetical protein